QKKSLEEEIYNLSHKQNDWLEPFQNWLEVAQNIDKIASDSDLFAKKVCAKEIFGSNLLLGEKSVRASAPKILNSFGKMGGNQWDALRASHLLALKKPLSSVLVTLTIQNSKPIVEFLKELSNTASRFASLQNKGFFLAKQTQEVLP
ncbi:MAG: hypothetical protein Q7R65_04750, partial [bacterium]|nr:hypothetical protein [bacterium]